MPISSRHHISPVILHSCNPCLKIFSTYKKKHFERTLLVIKKLPPMPDLISFWFFCHISSLSLKVKFRPTVRNIWRNFFRSSYFMGQNVRIQDPIQGRQWMCRKKYQTSIKLFCIITCIFRVILLFWEFVTNNTFSTWRIKQSQQNRLY